MVQTNNMTIHFHSVKQDSLYCSNTVQYLHNLIIFHAFKVIYLVKLHFTKLEYC